MPRSSAEITRDLRANLARREALKAELLRTVARENVARDDGIVADYLALKPIKEIQRKYRVSQWQVYKLVEARGVRRPYLKTMPRDVRLRYERARYRGGLSAEEAYALATDRDWPPRAHQVECPQGVSP